MKKAIRNAEQPQVRVLLIEDDPDDYALTRELLADIPEDPYHLDRAANYATGLEMLLRGEHEVCLLDYQLGARNGLELLKEAKSGGVNAAIIMLTGQEDRALDLAAMEAGATDFIDKASLTAATLERALRYALQQKRNADELEDRVASRTAELHESEERQRQVAADLSEAGRRKDEFMAMLAHELRNPLAPLRNAVHALQLSPENANEVRSIAQMLERQVGQMVHLVDDLLDVSRITRGKIELRREHIELASVVQQAVEAVSAQVECMEHDLKVIQPDGPIHLDADPVRLTQVIGNLLNNACKFTKNGGKLSLVVECEGDSAIIRVRDNGIGISPKDHARIFDMFMQLDSSLERPTSGLGLGLTLVHKLVHMHGGTVEVHSAGLGHGTEFTVRLPILTTAPVQKSAQQVRDTGTKARRVLIVDDNQDAATMLALLLKKTGHQTHTAFDGLTGLKAAGDVRPDIIIMDIGLPLLNGYETCRRIREEPWGRNIKIIALTGWGQEEDRKKSKEAGFNAHLVKPVDMNELRGLIAE